MADPMQAVYDMYLNKLQEQVNEVAETKKMLNKLAKDMGQEIPFPDVQAESVSGQPMRLDQFYGKKPATALTEFLELRGQNKGAASWQEIWAAFKRGGFKSDDSETEVKETLKKNTTAFKYFSELDAFGIKGWYSSLDGNSVRKKKGKTSKEKGDTEESEPENMPPPSEEHKKA